MDSSDDGLLDSPFGGSGNFLWQKGRESARKKSS
jgi:hypothetical protein